MVDEARFRGVMGHLATGVTIVTGRLADGSPVGLTANAVSSVSLNPVLVLVCLDRESQSHEPILASRRFAVNVLAADQVDVARRFASPDRQNRFDQLAVGTGATGSPLLEDALAWLDCTLWNVFAGGDHSIVVGEVQDCGARPGSPLIYFDGRYRGVAP